MTDPVTEKYIRKARERGYTDPQIVELMVHGGWSKKDAEKAVSGQEKKGSSKRPPKPVIGTGQRPGKVTAIAWIYLVVGSFGILGAIAWMLLLVVAQGALRQAVASGADIGSAGLLTGVVGWIIVLLYLIYSILHVMTGVGLLKMRSWSRKMAIVLGFIMLPAIPVGTILGILTLVFMFNDEVKQAFGV